MLDTGGLGKERSVSRPSSAFNAGAGSQPLAAPVYSRTSEVHVRLLPAITLLPLTLLTACGGDTAIGEVTDR